MVKKLVGLLGALIALLVLVLLAAAWLIDPDDYREQIASRASDQLGREVALEGPMGLRLFPWLALEIQDVRVGNPAEFDEAPDLARIGQATVSVRVLPLLRGELETGALTLSDATFTLVRDSQSRSNLDGLLAADGASDEPGDADLSSLSLGELRLDNVRVTLLDLARSEQQHVQIDAFRLDPFRAGEAVGFRLAGHFADGEDVLLLLERVDGEINLSPSADALSIRRLVAEFSVPGVGGGSLRSGLDLDMAAQPPQASMPVLDLIFTLEGLRVGLASEQPVTLALGDAIDVALSAARISLNEQNLDATGSLRLAERVQGRLDLSGDRLDLPPLLQALAGESSNQPTSEGATPDFEPLRAIDLDLGLRLAQLTVNPQLTLSDVEARARLQQGVLRLSPLEARLFGGRFEGLVEVDLREDEPQVRVQPRLAGIQVGELFQLVAPVAPLSGQGDVSLDLRFSGLSLEPILASLQGSGDYRLVEGALQGLDLRQLVDEELGRANLQTVSRSIGGQTAFDQLAGALAIEAGVVTLPDLNLVASDYGMTGRGQIDLPAGQLDYRLDVRLGERLTASLPRALAEATGGELPMRLAGPISQPTVTVDVAGLAERALRQQIEQRLLPPRSDTGADESGEDAPRRERSRDRLLRELIQGSDRQRQPPPDEGDNDESEPSPPPG